MKKIFKIIMALIIIQSLRIGFVNIMFMFVSKTVFNMKVINGIYMLLLIGIMIVVINKKHLEFNILPQKFNKLYIILSVLLAAFVISTPIITNDMAMINIISLLCNSVITVVFEELLFRGIIWKYLEPQKLSAYIVSSILFGLWHFGYTDCVIFRTSIFNPGADILKIIVYKSITGAALGFIFALLRYKTKNTYSSMMLHAFLNTIGN